MTPELYGTVVILVVLVMLSAFFSASETAFTSANRVKLKTMAQGGNKRAQIALNLAEDYDRLLSTILVGNNVVNIGASSMATGLFLALLSGNQSAATTVSTIVMTIVVLIFGESARKRLPRRTRRRLPLRLHLCCWCCGRLLRRLTPCLCSGRSCWQSCSSPRTRKALLRRKS